MSPASWDADALDTFDQSIAASPFGLLASPYEVMHGAHLYEYTNRKERALVAVRRQCFSGGNRLDIVGLASTGDRLQTKPFAAELDNLARLHESRILACFTQVPHVVSMCVRNGFGVSGAILLKVIDPS